MRYFPTRRESSMIFVITIFVWYPEIYWAKMYVRVTGYKWYLHVNIVYIYMI